MTLSHCWGSPKFEVLTAENRTEFEAGVSLSRIPQSFVDAIKVAEKLDSSYIWIDCYCIIQDSLSGEHLTDKLTDIAQMADIYSKSILNIGSLHPSNPNDGCFVSRNGCSPLLPQNFFPLLQERRLSPREYRVSHLGDAIDEQQSFGTSNLLERAWVLQKTRLCPSMLGFGRDKMFWECKRLGLASEILLGGDQVLPPMNQELFAVDDENCSDMRILASWLGTVKAYSGMQLSHPREDKLSAIGGIAKIAAERLRDDYSGGVFGRNIIKQLCWSVRSYQTLRPQSRSASEWRAPYWSWASIDGRVEFCNDTHEKLDGSTDMTTVYEAKIELTDPHNPYGSIKFASLELSGLLIPVNIGVMNGANGNLSMQKERSSPHDVDDAADNSVYFAESPVFAMCPLDDRIVHIDVDDLEKCREEALGSQYSGPGRRWYFIPIALEDTSVKYLHCLLLEQLSPRTYIRRGFTLLMQEKHQGIMELWREYLADELKEKFTLV